MGYIFFDIFPQFSVIPSVSSQLNKEAMADLVSKHKIYVLRNTVRSKDTNYVVDAIAQPNEIQLLEAAGYHIQRHEDVDEVGKVRQKEVGQGNLYNLTISADHDSTSSEES